MHTMDTHSQSALYLFGEKEVEKGKQELKDGMRKTKAQVISAKSKLKSSMDFLVAKIGALESENKKWKAGANNNNNTI